MRLKMWTYDLAREQAPTLDHMRRFLDLTREAGFDAIGLYMEHRFAYPSAPWAHGAGCVTPDIVRTLIAEYPDVRIVPFVNLLGHFEGMLYTEDGKRFAEERFLGLQACPSNPEFVKICGKLLDDVIKAFDDELVHIGGDETAQLGKCPRCAERASGVGLQASGRGMQAPDGGHPAEPRRSDPSDPSDSPDAGRPTPDAAVADSKRRLYAQHFGPLAQKAVEAGKRPAVWGDIFAEHPGARDALPKETLIFDWQYFCGVAESARPFLDRGFEVVGCPALHTYNAAWLHLEASERNVREVAADAALLGLYGVCVTTWECGLFGAYDTLFPALLWSGSVLREAVGDTADTTYRSYKSYPLGESENLPDRSSDPQWHREVADLSRPKDGKHMAALTQLGIATSRELLEASAAERGYPFIDLERLRPPKETLSTLPASILKAYIVFPVKRSGDNLWLAMANVRDVEAMDAAGASSGCKIIPAMAVPESVHAAIEAHFGSNALSEDESACSDWSRLMGVELERLGGVFGFSKTRSSLKCRLLLYANPFLAWFHHAEELCGERGDAALAMLELAEAVAPGEAERGVTGFVKAAVEFIRTAEAVRLAYAKRIPGEALRRLAVCRGIFDDLERIAKKTHARIGGSLADVERCKVARSHVETVMRRVREFGDGSLGYLPSFEHFTSLKFVPHDQGAWWRINRWGDE